MDKPITDKDEVNQSRESTVHTCGVVRMPPLQACVCVRVLHVRSLQYSECDRDLQLYCVVTAMQGYRVDMVVCDSTCVCLSCGRA